MADIAIFNHTSLCVIFKETQFNVSTKIIEGMRENFIYNISGSSVDNFWQIITETSFTKLSFGSKRAKILTMASVVIVISTVSGHVKGVKVFW